MESNRKVDVAVNVYGKPYQTAVTLLTLLKHSGEWINKIYFIEEKFQPEPPRFQPLLDKLGDKVIYFKPRSWFGPGNPKFKFLTKLKKYRHGIRYQYAWENSDQEFLLVTHNDVYFKKDLLKAYIEQIGEASGIGRIGQCWNCPALAAKKCDSESYTAYKPDYKEIVTMANTYPQARTGRYAEVIDPKKPWPLPECRLNEYMAMINLNKTRKDTIPKGKGSAFGSNYGLDTGVKWFADMNNMNHTFRHFDYDPYAIHSWVSLKNAGIAAQYNIELYQYEESVAKKVLNEEFNFTF